MSKKITPCEKLGYKVGDEFEVVEKSYKFDAGDVVCLQNDDGTASPYFTNEIVKDEYPLGVACFLYSVRKVAKLKPAKQALADAIHQNGGWVEGGEFAAQDKDGQEGCAVWFYSGGRPYEHNDSWYPSGNGDAIYGKHISCDKPFVNWNQAVLSRDEYFTAYPDEVKVEVKSETKHKVEVEMKSESEMIIKVGDWHKNGELPPVGAFVDVVGDSLIYGQGESNCEVIAHVENTAVIRMSYGLGCFESGAIIPARTEREKAIDEMVSLVEPLATYSEFAGAIYDAGMYKEVK